MKQQRSLPPTRKFAAKCSSNAQPAAQTTTDSHNSSQPRGAPVSSKAADDKATADAQKVEQAAERPKLGAEFCRGG